MLAVAVLEHMVDGVLYFEANVIRLIVFFGQQKSLRSPMRLVFLR